MYGNDISNIYGGREREREREEECRRECERRCERECEMEREHDRDHDRDRDRNRNENENNNGHVHEFLGSTMLAAPDNRRDLLHNHRFAGVSGPAIPFRGSHVHVIRTRTDFFENHFHEIDVTSGIAIPIYDQNHREIGHVHGFSGTTTVERRHAHRFKGATLIEDPTSREN